MARTEGQGGNKAAKAAWRREAALGRGVSGMGGRTVSAAEGARLRAVGPGLICHLQAALGSVLRVQSYCLRPPEVLKRVHLGRRELGGKTLTHVLQAQLSRRPRNSEVPTGEPEGRPGSGW